MSIPQITPEMLEGPAMMPPPGVIPNLVDPYTAGPILISVSSVLVGLMILFVFNRLATKAFVTRKFQWDDLTCVLGTLGTIAYFVMSVVAVQKAKYGTHQWDVPLKIYISDTTNVIIYLSLVLAPITLLFIKATFFLLFLQLFRPSKSLRAAIYGGLGFTVVFYLVTFILAFVSATPRAGETWLQHLAGGGVMNIMITGAVWIPTVGIVIDLYILILPLYCVSTLNLPTSRKIQVASVFLTGILAVISSILCLAYRIQIFKEPLNDVTYAQIKPLVTSIVEMTLGVMVSCMPAFSRMVRHVQPGFATLRSRLTGGSYATGTKGSQYSKKSFGNSYPQHSELDERKLIAMDRVKPWKGGDGYERASSQNGEEHTPRFTPSPNQQSRNNKHGGIEMRYDVHVESQARNPRPAGHQMV